MTFKIFLRESYNLPVCATGDMLNLRRSLTTLFYRDRAVGRPPKCRCTRYRPANCPYRCREVGCSPNRRRSLMRRPIGHCKPPSFPTRSFDRSPIVRCNTVGRPQRTRAIRGRDVNLFGIRLRTNCHLTIRSFPCRRVYRLRTFPANTRRTDGTGLYPADPLLSPISSLNLTTDDSIDNR